MDKKERAQKAVEFHAQGYNCCQSVLLACCDLCGITEEAAAKLGYGFAGGMYCGEVCGAVTGALMALGGSLPDGAPGEHRPMASAASQELEAHFNREFSSILCREILVPEGKKICDRCIALGAEKACEIIEKINKGELEQ